MAKAKVPEPLLKTPEDQINKVEQYKLASDELRAPLGAEVQDMEEAGIGEEAEQIAKSHGIYLEYNRALTGREKDWMYMVRVTCPGGGSFNREQWKVFDELADKYCDHNPYGAPSLRLTTRQNIQYHWLKKDDLVPLVRDLAQTGYYALNGCGDNARNVMACPISHFNGIYDANAKAKHYGAYFRLPSKPHIEVFGIDPKFINDPDQQFSYGKKLLNRKFKIAFSSVIRDPQTGELLRDDCVEMRTNDVGVAPILEDEKVVAYQVFVGGGQGERNGKATFAGHSHPFGIFTEDNLTKGLDAIVKVHQEWGDRKNRHWARLKYVINKQGVGWYQDEVRKHGAEFELPQPDLDPGARLMHHGWIKQHDNGKWAYGAYIECGRLVDSTYMDDPEHKSGNVTGNGRLKSMVPGVLDAFDGVEVLITANQDLVFTNIPEDAKEDFEAKLGEYGYGERNGKKYSKLRVLSGACVGLPTCRLSYTDSEQYEPELMDTLDDMGLGDRQESIGITGCERQCFRPGTKSIGLVGQGPNMYALKLGGSEDGRHQGNWFVVGSKWYLRQVPREQVPTLIQAIFDYCDAEKQDGEDLGAVTRRLGAKHLKDYLESREDTQELFKKGLPAPYIPEHQITFARPDAAE